MLENRQDTPPAQVCSATLGACVVHLSKCAHQPQESLAIDQAPRKTDDTMKLTDHQHHFSLIDDG